MYPNAVNSKKLLLFFSSIEHPADALATYPTATRTTFSQFRRWRSHLGGDLKAELTSLAC
jgi:hypothetical protein